MKFCKVKATIFLSFFFIFSASAQFNTVTRKGSVNEKSDFCILQSSGNKPNSQVEPTEKAQKSDPSKKIFDDRWQKSSLEIQYKRKSPKFGSQTPPSNKNLHSLPLTFPNLVAVMKHYKIRFPRIVLAQAIQETGWLRSNVCRTKNNLFGLTDPRTGDYFEFTHWTESVRAYGTMVQYKYKGGDYFLWLEEIGYAGDPNYTTSLKKIIARYL